MPDSYLAYDIKNDYLTLFIPPIDPEDVIWSGLPLLEKEAMEKSVTEVLAYQSTTNVMQVRY